MAFELMIAYSLDLLIGDPIWFPHPVRAIGRGITALERYLRQTTIPLRLAGAILTITIVVLTYGLVWLICHLAGIFHPYLGKAIAILLIFMSLSVRSLAQAAKKVYSPLKAGNINQARRQLGQIVSRETATLDRDSVIRGTVETVAENTVDGVVSPLFYALIGGAPLAWAYKAINTLDSMVGYKDERYLKFGWFSARLDDIANFIPARLSGVIIPLAAFLIGKNSIQSIKTVFADGRKAESPNAGFPEAAVAGALGIQLGGQNIYHGRVSNRPLIGNPIRPKEPEDIKQAIHLMYATSVLALMGGMLMT
ncbi:MAG: adenosylcobinamide-phosphate synthase CbiB [Deltaproteobacteria bacterium]|nr:adenosylcobinamide-phosphate synthase CbiB [Deltaproteobacteria bacterium]